MTKDQESPDVPWLNRGLPIGNRRYSRLGNLRYIGAIDDVSSSCAIIHPVFGGILTDGK
jgi:hypothetical protein